MEKHSRYERRCMMEVDRLICDTCEVDNAGVANIDFFEIQLGDEEGVICFTCLLKHLSKITPNAGGVIHALYRVGASATVRYQNGNALLIKKIS